LTDLEFYEMRYSGQAASAVRGFRAVYLGFFFNCFIMATVNLAACKIAAVLFGFDRWQTLLAVGVLNVVFAAHSGLWGVMVIDMVQFFIKMSAVIAAAYFAVTLPQVGGMSGLVDKLSHMHGPQGVPSSYLSMLPDFKNNWDLAVVCFIVPLTVQWWATWYPGAEPGGGSYIAQRMLGRNRRKTPWAARSSSTWRITFCGHGRGFWWGSPRSSCIRNWRTSGRPFRTCRPRWWATISRFRRCCGFCRWAGWV
jgi:Na+/proline symporter